MKLLYLYWQKQLIIVKSQINRILSGNGLKILRDNEYVLLKKEELLSEVENFDGCVFKVGKRNFVKIIVK